MSQRLCVQDAVLVNISSMEPNLDHIQSNNTADDQSISNGNIFKIGIIKYIGIIDGIDSSSLMTEWIGIELVECIEGGHNGIINGTKYFQCPAGHGIHTRITNVIRKLESYEVTKKLQEIIILFKTRLGEYVNALSERDDYIEQLKNTHRHLRGLLKAAQANYRNGLKESPSSMSKSTDINSPSLQSIAPASYNQAPINKFNPSNKILSVESQDSVLTDVTASTQPNNNQQESSIINLSTIDGMLIYRSIHSHIHF